MVNVDHIPPGGYRFVDGQLEFVPPPKPKKQFTRYKETPLSVVLAIRQDFRWGLSYRALAKRHKVSLGTIRHALNASLYAEEIAEAEGGVAQNLVGVRSHLQPKDARRGIEQYHKRGKADYVPALSAADKRARNAERMQRVRAEQRLRRQTPGCDA